jgi:ABC-type amino acid transport substrate-binding protein
MMRKQLWRLIPFLLLALFLPATGAQAQARTLIVAVERDYPPFTFVDEAGDLAGFSVELMDALAEIGGFQVEYQMVEFSYLVPGVATRLFDVGISCIFIRPARQALVDFSDPYYSGGMWLITLENSGIEGLDDLTPTSKVGVINGTAGENYAREQLQVEVLEADFADQAFDLLANAAVVAVIYERESLMEYLATHPDVPLRTVGAPLSYDECAIAVNKGELRLLLAINEALAQVRENGRYDQIYGKWFGDLDPLTQADVVEGNGEQVEVAAPLVSTPIPITPTTILTNQVTGVYYLTISTDPVRYQIASLTADGLWLAVEAGPSLPTAGDAEHFSPQQQGVWEMSPAQMVAATVLSFAAASDQENQPVLVRQAYTMKINQTGEVTGSYTAHLYSLAQNPLDATATPSQTVTVNFTGHRVQNAGNE